MRKGGNPLKPRVFDFGLFQPVRGLPIYANESSMKFYPNFKLVEKL